MPNLKIDDLLASNETKLLEIRQEKSTTFITNKRIIIRFGENILEGLTSYRKEAIAGYSYYIYNKEHYFSVKGYSFNDCGQYCDITFIKLSEEQDILHIHQALAVLLTS